jgi:hypothetical protein
MVVLWLGPWLALAPERRLLLARPGRPEPVLAIAAVSAAALCGGWAVHNAGVSPTSFPLGLSGQEALDTVRIDLAGVALALGMAGLFGVVSLARSTVPALLAGAALEATALAGFVWPDDLGSPGIFGASALAAWGAVLIVTVWIRMAGRVDWTAVGAVAALVGALFTGGTVLYTADQLHQVQSSLRSAGSQAVFTQQQDVNRLFLQDGGEDLIPYFFSGENPPADMEAKASVVAGSILDFFANVEAQQTAGSFEVDDGWSAYIEDSFRNSPTLCRVLSQNKPMYGGEDGWIWTTFAKEACGDIAR